MTTYLAEKKQPLHINFKEVYDQWGRGNGMDPQLATASPEQIDQAKRLVAEMQLDTAGLPLSYAACSDYYQGPEIAALTVALLRYSDPEAAFGGQHVSVVIDVTDVDQPKLIGITRMLEISKKLPGYPEVFDRAKDSLPQLAPDLFDPSELAEIAIELPAGESDLSSGIKFEGGVPLGTGVELLWIAPHGEDLTIAGEEKTINGMKVKMHRTDGSDLYLWGIFGDDSQLLTFEKNVYWDHGDFRRLTPMLLHDGWLQAHGLDHWLLENGRVDQTATPQFIPLAGTPSVFSHVPK